MIEGTEMENNSLLEALLPSAVRSLIGSSAPAVPQSTLGTSAPILEHDLRIKVLSPEGSADVVLWHRAARVFSHSESGEVHQATFSLGDAKKRKQFADACEKALEEKLAPDKLDKLRKDIEEELLSEWQQLKANERWRESESKRTAAEKLNETERRAGKSLLKDSSLLYRVGRALQALGLVGETVNGLLLYLAITSRLMSKILSVAVKAESSAGKSFLTDIVLKLFPEEAYIPVSGMSDKALYYDDEDYKHRMLILAEAAGIREGAEYSLRTLLSENKLKLKTVDKDAKGRNQGRELEKEGPTGLILTTTKARMNLENETRYLSIGLDESEEQSQRIKDATAQRWERGASRVKLDQWINAQKLLEPVEVRIPFASFLSQRTPKNPKRIRRDFDKLMLLIAASAALHQRQRRKGITEAGEVKIIEASVLDYFFVKELFEKVFFQSLHGIHPSTRKVMEAIKKVYREKSAVALPDPVTGLKEDVTVSTQELADELKVSKPTVLKWVEPLEEYGWIIVGGEGKANEYRPGIEPDPKKSVLPSIEELVKHQPELLPEAGIETTHPITGEKLKLGGSEAPEIQASRAVEIEPPVPAGTLICNF